MSPTQSSSAEDQGDTKVARGAKAITTSFIVYVMPFTNNASLQLPSVYFLIELVDNTNVDFKVVGGCLAANYICRVLALYSCIYSPRAAAVVGTIVSLLAYVTMAATTNNKLAFIVASVAVGLGEIFATLQILAKESFSVDGMKTVGHILKVQITVQKLSTITTFFAGGFSMTFSRLRELQRLAPF